MYSLRKCRHVLRHNYHLFCKKKDKLEIEVKREIQHMLIALQTAILKKDKRQSIALSEQVSTLGAIHLKKTGLHQLGTFLGSLLFALVVAILVRQIWFEFYEIPSGSMRPTFKEQDRLMVTKDTFGINIPLTPKEFYFDSDLVQRNGIVIFTGENMDIRDVDTMYFYIFPGKKQYVKRLMAKPGDIIYFYGGKIYGIDAKGNDISEKLQLPSLDGIEHIPFIDFDRKIFVPQHPVGGIYSPVYIYQMNEPVAKLTVNASSQIQAEMSVPASVHDSSAPSITNFGDLWGFKNFAMVRLLTKDQIKNLTDQPLSVMEEAPLYLEIKHNPSLVNVKLIRDEMGRLRPSIGLNTSIIPLQENHLKELMQNMYTARFQIKNGKAFRYGLNADAAGNIFAPSLPHVPDGCYEFYNGIAYEIKWSGIATRLPDSHPLYRFSNSRVQLLFNLGIEWDTRFSPQVKNQRLVPARYTYFRDGDLYLLGTPVLKKGEPTLERFLSSETTRKQSANPQVPYHPFVDHGPPLKNGILDKDLIRHEGLLIPDKSYLALGDNHAMSADSREFGFVPEGNLRGTPSFIFWPPGPRFGAPNQPSYPWLTVPKVSVWLLGVLCITFGIIYWRRRNALPLKFEESLSNEKI